jgi:hypothetical protein
VIDVSNPVSPRRVGSYETFGEPAIDVAVSGGYAYVARWASGLQVIDVRDPVNPRRVGEYDTPGSALGVAVSGSYAYVADGSSLQVIDVSDPTKPRLVGSYAPFDMALSVLVNDKYAYVVDRNAGLRVIDVCNPSNLRKVGGYDTSAWAFGVAISGNYAYLANWDAGLQVLRIEAVAPQVVVEPSRRTLNGGEDATFTATVQGLGPAYYQWFKDGIALPGQNGAVLTRPGVREADSGRYEVVVRDECGRGGSATATLAVLVPGSGGRAEERIEVSPSVPPAPQGSGLVLITHGWAPSGERAAWVDEMAEAIRQALEARGQRNWVVETVHWENWAWGLPETALDNGRIEGGLLGKAAAKNHWAHIHLIAHSAGSALIEEFARQIKKVWGNQTTIHSTFLDAFEGFFRGWADMYGEHADWADAYFSRDLTAGWTGGRLPHAHAVDVTSATPESEWVEQPIYCEDPGTVAGSTPMAVLPCGYQKVPKKKASHDYPHDFYLHTIRGELPACVSEYGFALSKEAGGWEKRVDYPVNNQPVVLCTEPLPSSRPAVWTSRPLNFTELQPVTGPGTAFAPLGQAGFQLGRSPFRLHGGAADAPVWLAVAVEATNRVNYVQFEAAFTGNPPGEGLLSVYWNTNRIGFLDERVDAGPSRTWQFELPGEYAPGVYTLSFQLDLFGGRDSTVSVTNVALGFAGLSEPARLAWAGWTTNGLPVLTLSAPAPSTFQVQSSTNLADWEGVAWLVNTNGTVVFTDPAATNAAPRFYRAVLR